MHLNRLQRKAIEWILTDKSLWNKDGYYWFFRGNNCYSIESLMRDDLDNILIYALELNHTRITCKGAFNEDGIYNPDESYNLEKDLDDIINDFVTLFVNKQEKKAKKNSNPISYEWYKAYIQWRG